MRRVAQIWLLIAASPVVGCSTPTAPTDAAGHETASTVRAVPVQKRPVYVMSAPIQIR
jgi:hypothetical protein